MILAEISIPNKRDSSPNCLVGVTINLKSAIAILVGSQIWLSFKKRCKFQWNPQSSHITLDNTFQHALLPVYIRWIAKCDTGWLIHVFNGSHYPTSKRLCCPTLSLFSGYYFRKYISRKLLTFLIYPTDHNFPPPLIKMFSLERAQNWMKNSWGSVHPSLFSPGVVHVRTGPTQSHVTDNENSPSFQF